MASKTGEYVLYDIPSKGRPSCWSPNTWKARMVFAYKGLPYKTQWVEYPDIAPTLTSLGIAPNPVDPTRPEQTAYTVPAVTFPDGTTIMDSAAIATRIEQEHPNPPLRGLLPHSTEVQPADSSSDPAAAKVAELNHLISGGMLAPLSARMMPAIVEDIVTDVSRPHREAKAERQLGGRKIADIKAGWNLEEGLKQVSSGIKQLGEWADQSGGPWVGGKEPIWTDILLVSLLEFIRHCAQDLFNGIVAQEGSGPLKRIYDMAKEKGWLSRDD